jgi:cysteinyl-tRNA synthetase
MDDDFNAAQALGVLFETVRATNRFLAESREIAPGVLPLIASVRHLFDEVGTVLGLFTHTPAAWLEEIKNAKTGLIDLTAEEIERLIAERTEVRAAKNFKRGDEIRDLLLAKGIQLLDSAQGTTWNMK